MVSHEPAIWQMLTPEKHKKFEVESYYQLLQFNDAA
jgi:hypothetical protein